VAGGGLYWQWEGAEEGVNKIERETEQVGGP